LEDGSACVAVRSGFSSNRMSPVHRTGRASHNALSGDRLDSATSARITILALSHSFLRDEVSPLEERKATSRSLRHLLFEQPVLSLFVECM
jgi:hypothetical protein